MQSHYPLLMIEQVTTSLTKAKIFAVLAAKTGSIRGVATIINQLNESPQGIGVIADNFLICMIGGITEGAIVMASI